MGRARHISRREPLRNRSSAQGRRPQFFVFAHSNEPSSNDPVASLSPTLSGADQQSALASGSGALSVNNQWTSSNYRSPSPSSPNSQDRAGPSEAQSFPESLKSRFNAISTRYIESISTSTRGWKERFFSRNTSMEDIGPEVRREVNPGIATVSRMMERLETRDNRNSTDTITRTFRE
ncbi:E3 ubiquitin-protein ligase RHF2A-like [Hibiscus syriacus]|nr:E3 ubiquitin-protein ligase RHF2A-like [Hibiscus syriacus]